MGNQQQPTRDELQARLDLLEHEQQRLVNELRHLRDDLRRLDQPSDAGDLPLGASLSGTSPSEVPRNESPEFVELPASVPASRSTAFNDLVFAVPELQADAPSSKSTQPGTRATTTESGSPAALSGVRTKPKTASNIEKFIGENLINKIGIAITVIGVGIGAKYAIDHDLISPLTRIVLGYILGLGLFAVAARLRVAYEAFSAVLLSGSLAIMYFITFAAYSFYGIIPSAMAFALMVLITSYTVVAATTYNREVIALIGLVGAYAIPILLSDGSGRVEIMLSYMSIINVGILLISMKRQWEKMRMSAFILSWLIFVSWFGSSYHHDAHWAYALVFSHIFFITFYASLLAYPLRSSLNFRRSDELLIILNSVLCYGVGVSVLSRGEWLPELRGVFTLAHAVVHFMVGSYLYRRQLVDKTMLYVVGTLVLFFVTITIPVQLDGIWVSMCWSAEAVLLTWLGRRHNIAFYRHLSVIVAIVALLSVYQDWDREFVRFYYLTENNSALHIDPPFLNLHFLSSLLCTACFAAMWYIRSKAVENEVDSEVKPTPLQKLISALFPLGTLNLLYGTFSVEISYYWTRIFFMTMDPNQGGDQNLMFMKMISHTDYTLVFTAALGIVVYRVTQSSTTRSFAIVAQQLAMLMLCIVGLDALDHLALRRMTPADDSWFGDASIFGTSPWNYNTRYITFALLGVLLYSGRIVRSTLSARDLLRRFAQLSQHIVILIVLCAELGFQLKLHAMDDSFDVSMSILWGLYSLLLIGVGIRLKQKDIRIMAIALFGVTLMKLVLFDLSYLDTIAKTIAFVGLGLLLLVISFLYNKYKSIIFEDNV